MENKTKITRYLEISKKNNINLYIHELVLDKRFDELFKITDINILKAKNIDGDTVAHLLVRNNELDVFIKLIKKFPDLIHEKNSNGCTPFLYLSGLPNIIEIIDKTNVDDHVIMADTTLLSIIIFNDKNDDKSTYLLNKFKNANKSPANIISAFNSIMNQEKKEKLIISMIEKHGFDPSSINVNSENILMMAIDRDLDKVSKYLINNGADINYFAIDQIEKTPLIMSIEKRKYDIAKLILSKKPLMDKISSEMSTYATVVLRMKDIPNDILLKIIEMTDNLNIPDYTMNTAFYLIVSSGIWENCTDILSKKVLDISYSNQYVKNIVNIVPLEKRDKFINMLIDSYIHISKKLKISILNREQIKKIIMAGHSYPREYDEKYRIKICPDVNYTRYKGHTMYYIYYLQKLVQKYPTLKIVTSETSPYFGSLNNGIDENDKLKMKLKSFMIDELFEHIIMWQDSDNNYYSPTIIENTKKILKKYPDTEFVVYYLSLIWKNETYGHANVLIYDVKNNLLERFDPDGIYGKKIVGLDQFIQKIFKPLKAKYISPADYENMNIQFITNNTGFGLIEEGMYMYCLAWCLWYIETRIMNKHIHPKKLLKNVIIELYRSDTLIKYIRNYSEHIIVVVEKLFKKLKIPLSMLFYTYLPARHYRKIEKYLRDVFL